MFRVSRSFIPRCLPLGRPYYTIASNPQIYIHENSPQGIYSITLSPEGGKPLGYTTSKTDINPETFRPVPPEVGKELVEGLTQSFRENIDKDPHYQSFALMNPNGFLAISDFRNPPPYGRIPDVDDTIGTVYVDQEGLMVPKSFEWNNMYRFVSSHGFMVLPDVIYKHFKSVWV